MDELKNQIVETALQHFLQHGVRKITNDNLVAVLGISTKTLYKYFTNKEALIEEALHLYHDRRYEMLQNLPAKQNAVCTLFDIWYTAIETEPAVSQVFYDDLQYYYPRLAEKVESSISKKFSDKFLGIIRQGIQQKVFLPGIIPEIVLEGIYAIYISIVRERRYKHIPASNIEVMQNTMTILLRGCCTTKGINALDRHVAALLQSLPKKKPAKRTVPQT